MITARTKGFDLCWGRDSLGQLRNGYRQGFEDYLRNKFRMIRQTIGWFCWLKVDSLSHRIHRGSRVLHRISISLSRSTFLSTETVWLDRTLMVNISPHQIHRHSHHHGRKPNGFVYSVHCRRWTHPNGKCHLGNKLKLVSTQIRKRARVAKWLQSIS